MKKPTLNALRSFEAAARNKSFTLAAHELSVTQGAISKQIKGLEAYFGEHLFDRSSNRLVLTRKGAEYLHGISGALMDIQTAADRLLKQDALQEMLHLDVLPTFSSRWLIPNLTKFNSIYPDINICINQGDGSIIFSDGADLAIRSAITPTWNDCLAEKICSEELVLVCSPDIYTDNMEEIFAFELIQHSSRECLWEEYLKAQGFTNPKRRHTYHFEHFYMIIEAARNGLGLALLPQFLIKQELDTGVLISVFENTYASPFTYYLVYRNHLAKDARVLGFIDWIKSHIS